MYFVGDAFNLLAVLFCIAIAAILIFAFYLGILFSLDIRDLNRKKEQEEKNKTSNQTGPSKHE